ncbi:MAG: phosphoribosylaminoimidazolesuccinocarboxamide synthase [Candidatus Altiarchaeota archaeon]|nr:phosphoribosylaminoimidazolesuccinocarboxamide synthase [Candidatus Altiarchaeota archaeon]
MDKTGEIVLKTSLPLKVYRSGKVRDIYELGNDLLMVTTDRISAFDCVLPSGIPNKGRILTGLSVFWFDFTRDFVKNHLISADAGTFPGELSDYYDLLEGRSMLVKRTERIDIECVVRGYLSGSAWKEYKSTGTVCGIRLPSGLSESEELPEPIFTPAMKADTGHDVNISEGRMAGLVGADLAGQLKELSLGIYEKAASKALSGGVIIADSKFEFGVLEGEVILIDELLTPDSSRFWSLEDYSPGGPRKSFDKQFVRDYLEGIGWNKQPPAPRLPEDIVEKTLERYLEAYRRITGRDYRGPS